VFIVRLVYIDVLYVSLQYFDTSSWLGLLTCKNRLPYNLYCVGGDIKHCSIHPCPWLHVTTQPTRTGAE